MASIPWGAVLTGLVSWSTAGSAPVLGWAGRHDIMDWEWERVWERVWERLVVDG